VQTIESRLNMESNDPAPGYRIWGIDNVAYGPVELPTLVSWVKQQRVTQDTWVFSEPNNAWTKAGQLPELSLLFRPKSTSSNQEEKNQTQLRITGIKPGELRRIKIFGDMDEKQLESFLQYMEILKFRQFTQVVRKGDHGDAMFLVLEGELRSSIMIDGKESILSTMSAGEFFGEVSLLDHGPRSADVYANLESVLLKISAANFNKLVGEAPALATPFLFALSRSVVARVRTLTKKYQDSIHFSRTAAAAH
jgi:CRP/FNR family cyclic AMP-dependent transcriptional regulator